jgi:hypothetical protein
MFTNGSGQSLANRRRPVPLERFVNPGKLVRMVMSVELNERRDGHAEITGGLPRIGAVLHHPRRRGKPGLHRASQFSKG